MNKVIVTASILIILTQLVHSCLITNCPRGGKRSPATNVQESIKQCVSCGPARSGQCFGPDTCCGPFGCLMGTADSMRCRKEGNFHESEPCVAGTMSCRKNTGRCASDSLCCSQDACFVDKSCTTGESLGEKTRFNIDLYNLLGELAGGGSD